MAQSTSIGHYRLDALIGQGGMGEVFRAHDTRLNRPVAVKLVRASEHVPAGVDRLLREARAASALNHPNIVVIHEVGETPAGDHFIVQEFVDGATLRLLLQRALPFARVLEVGVQIARALAVAHGAGIVHRDVKPENIMVREDGLVKVLDFGVARQATGPTSSLSTETDFRTLPGTLVGTPAYMAPEQASGGVSGPQADIFAFGVVLYEMTCGRRPFEAATPLATLASILTDQPLPLSRVDPTVPRAFDDLVQQMLQKAPDLRPTARDVERDLTALAARAAGVLQGGAAPFRATTVGREEERAHLLRAFARVRDGHGHMVAVTGEPGIGKTSLIEDFLRDLPARAERATVAKGRCSESLAGAEAYLPILEVLDGLLHRGDGPSLARIIKTVAPTWYGQVASESVDARVAGEPRESPPAGSQERMKRELGALFQELSRLQPLVLVIEDLHWADVSTVDVLNYLAARFADMRLLVVASYRPSDLALARHAFLGVRLELQSRGQFEEIALRFLTPDDVERYLAVQFPQHRFPPEFTAAVHRKTDGSPLFMVDLVRYLRDTGRLVEQEGRWVLAGSVSDVPRDLPESVLGMIGRKIERVGEDDRPLLLAASVQGTEFDAASIAEALSRDAGEVEERLDALERLHVLVRRGEEHEFPDRTVTLKYHFVHVLYQNVLYASLQPTRRAALSGRIARSLLAHHGSDVSAIAARLARLFETARDFASSARYFLAAAERAASLFAFREALSLADRGLEGLRGIAETPERQQLELPLQMVRGLAVRSVKGWAAPELEAAFGRARELCQALGDRPELFPVLWNIAFFNMIRGDLSGVRDETRMLLAQAEQAGRPAFVMAAHHLAGVTSEFVGDIVASSRLLERARELHDPAQHRGYTETFGIDPGMVARAMSSRPLWSLGYPDRAAVRGRETIALGRSQRQPVTLAFALIVAEGIHLYRGEAEQAIALGDEAEALCREYEFPQEAEWARAFRGAALGLLGRMDEGIAQLRSSLDAMLALRSGLVRTVFLTLYADALRRAGRIDEGLAAIDEGVAHAERTIERGFVAELNRVRGDLLQAAGNGALAEHYLRAAIDVAREQQARSFELRAATALGRLLAGSPREAEALGALRSVLDWFTEGHATADHTAARAVLG